jgi:hypothetical protein
MSASSRVVLGLVVALLAASAAIWAFLPRGADQPDAAPPVEPARPSGAGVSGEREPPPGETVREPERAEEVVAPELPPSGDLFALLAWLEPKGRGPLPEVVGDGQRFDALFDRAHREIWIEGGPYLKKAREPLRDGATLAIEPGAWRIEGLDPVGTELPADVTLSGSGSNATLVVLGALQPRGNVVRLTVRDCTLFPENRPFLDLPQGYAAITFQRVRLVGWDSGVGFAPLVRAKGLGVRMIDCELAGGYGRAPGSGCLFEVPSAALLARLERCKLSFARTAADRWNAGASVALADCVGLDMVDDLEAQVATRPGIVLQGTSLVLRDPQASPPRLELESLFPGWERKLE